MMEKVFVDGGVRKLKVVLFGGFPYFGGGAHHMGGGRGGNGDLERGGGATPCFHRGKLWVGWLVPLSGWGGLVRAQPEKTVPVFSR